MSRPLQITIAGCLIAGVAAWLSMKPDREGLRADWWQGEQQRIELSQRLELCQFRFEQLGDSDVEGLVKLQASVAGTASAIKSLSQQRSTLQAELEGMQSQWAAFRRSAIREQRQRAMGKTFEVLQSLSGRTFNDVRVSVIDDGGVTIRHADGSARLGFEDLDARQRAFFGLEADLSLAAAEKESRDAAAYEQWVEAGLARNEEKSQRASEIAMREAADSRRKQTALLERQLAASNERPLAQVASSVGNRSWSSSRYSSSNYQTYRPTYRYVYYYNVPAYSAASRFPTSVCGPSVRVPTPRVPYVRPKVVTPR